MKKIIKDLITERNLKIRRKPGFPDIGKRQDCLPFSKGVQKIEKSWYFYDSKLFTYETDQKIINFGTGNPIDYKAFPYTIKRMKKNINKKMYRYPPAAGDEKAREKIAEYLKSIGFSEHIDYTNIIITCSTTQAFYLILKSILKEYDTIIVTAPNYGLFTFMPERMNINVEMLELNEKNGYMIDPQKLNELIINVNKKSQKKYKNLSYQPRVKAFLNINPHNPLGTVMSKKDIKLLKSIGDVCIKNNIFVIDDLIYRDLSYDRNELAMPIAAVDNNLFDYSISMFGLSKSYGMASARAGFVVANDYVIREMRNNLFYVMDSAPYIQSTLLALSYNNDVQRNKCYNKYFKNIIKIYMYNRELSIALVEGIDIIQDKCLRSKIKKKVKSVVGRENLEQILTGIPYATVKLVPSAGFFLLIDFTEISRYTDIKSEKDLLKYLYVKAGAKFLMGQSFSWPNEKEIIARISYSLKDTDIILALSKINIAIREAIKYETNRNNSKSK